ncbi:MAG: DUF3035 domain-containing protein [Alphaproteobacteria bacterium]|jgi:hypothetical protein
MANPQQLTCLAAAGALLVLAGCSGSEPLVGIGNQPFSQVTVQRTIPLTVPPGYGERPDGTEAEVVAGGTVIDQQETNTLAVAVLNATMGEQLLLERSGALEADPLVRAKLNRENALLVGQPEFVDELLFGSFATGGAVEVIEGTYEVSDVEIEQGTQAGSDIVIEQNSDETSWFDDAWDSLGQ